MKRGHGIGGFRDMVSTAHSCRLYPFLSIPLILLILSNVFPPVFLAVIRSYFTTIEPKNINKFSQLCERPLYFRSIYSGDSSTANKIH